MKKFSRLLLCLFLLPSVQAANLVGPSDFDQALLNAISQEDIVAIHQAIQAGARVNSDGKGLNPGLPPLILAILVNNPESVDVLLKAGADPNLVQNSQYPLYQAVNADTRILKLVLNAKANPNTPVFLGYTPLQRAASCKRQTYEELSRNGSYKGNFPDCELSIRLLLNAGASIEFPGFHKNTPLIEAVYWNNLNTAKILLEAGANIEAISAVQDTPLKTALRNYAEEQYSLRQKSTYKNGHVLPMIELLLKNRASVDFTFEGRYDEFDDAKYTIGNFAGNTPLTLAARYGWINLARLLLQNRADPTLARSDGMKPYEIAQQHGHIEIAMLIKQSMKLKPFNSSRRAQ